MTVKTFTKIKEDNKKLNVFTTLTEDHAIIKAGESSARINDEKKLPLDGILVSVKDNFCTKSVPTTCASK